jgi:putative transposase
MAFENWVNTPLDRLRWDELLVDSVKGKTPLERLNYLIEEMGHPITMPPPRQEWMAALFDHKMCTLSAKTGITLEHGFHYKGEAMSYLLAKYGDHAQLHVLYNPDDFRQAYVYEDDDLPLVTLTHEHVRPQTPAWTFAEAKDRFDSGMGDWMVPDDKVQFSMTLTMQSSEMGRQGKPSLVANVKKTRKPYAEPKATRPSSAPSTSHFCRLRRLACAFDQSIVAHY